MKRIALALAGGLSIIATASGASPLSEQALRLSSTDRNAALELLRNGDAQGDADASPQLAHALFFWAAPHMDRAAACGIAERLAAADNAAGHALVSACVFTGQVQAADRLAAARNAARKAAAGGAPLGGVMLFWIFNSDPRYTYLGADGKADAAKYEQLAALPIEARAEQSEAWSGLSMALERRDSLAAGFAASALVDTSAPGNIDRLLSIADTVPAAPIERLRPALLSARTLKHIGNTHASVHAAADAHRAATPFAASSTAGAGGPCHGVMLSRIEAGPPPAEAQYLPVASGPLVNALLVRGRWTERWTFSGCGRKAELQVAFNADGWGGARFDVRSPTAVAPTARATDTP